MTKYQPPRRYAPIAPQPHRLVPWSPDWSHRLLPEDAQRRLRTAADLAKDPLCTPITRRGLIDAAVDRVMADHPSYFKPGARFVAPTDDQ